MTSLLNEEVRLRTPLPGGWKLIIDLTDILELMSNFIDSHLEMGLHKKTMRPLQKTHETRKRLLDAKHPDSLSIMTSLAKSFIELGKDREALQLNKKMREVRKGELDDEYPNTSQSMKNLAISYSKVGRDKEAILCTSRL